MRENNELGMKCIKFMLVTISIMFMLTSALVITVGTTVYGMYHDLDFLLEPKYLSPASMVVVVGFIMMFVSMFGVFGALRESTCLVNTFAFLLSLVFILEVSAAIAAYHLKRGVGDMLDYGLRNSLQTYTEDEESKFVFDFLQTHLNCCGVSSYEDWADAKNLTAGIFVSNITVPDSCCASVQVTWVDGLETDVCIEMYANGCLPRIEYFMKQSAALLATGAMTVAFIQLIGIIFALMMAKSIRTAKTIREMRRWAIVEQMINNSYDKVPSGDEKKPYPVTYVPQATK